MSTDETKSKQDKKDNPTTEEELEQKQIKSQYNQMQELLTSSWFPITIVFIFFGAMFFISNTSADEILKGIGSIYSSDGKHGELKFAVAIIITIFVSFFMIKALLSLIHLVALAISLVLTSSSSMSRLTMIVSMTLLALFASKYQEVSSLQKNIEVSSIKYVSDALKDYGRAIKTTVKTNSKLIDMYSPKKWDCEVENLYRTHKVRLECFVGENNLVTFKVLKDTEVKPRTDTLRLPQVSRTTTISHLKVNNPSEELLAKLKPRICPDESITVDTNTTPISYYDVRSTTTNGNKASLLYKRKEKSVDVGTVTTTRACLEQNGTILHTTTSKEKAVLDGYKEFNLPIYQNKEPTRRSYHEH